MAIWALNPKASRAARAKRTLTSDIVPASRQYLALLSIAWSARPDIVPCMEPTPFTHAVTKYSVGKGPGLPLRATGRASLGDCWCKSGIGMVHDGPPSGFPVGRSSVDGVRFA